MKTIKEILEKSFEGSPVLDIALLQKSWPTLVGSTVAQNSQPVSLRDKNLFIWVKNSSWMTELSLMKGEILKKVRESRGDGKIEEIRFVLKKPDPST
ncbi:MAG: DUF721 domain-containing protein [Deltaproteobacteria bacterium]|nr:DUF721 domain-containing protein [Deltaproteobacteria bacterium]